MTQPTPPSPSAASRRAWLASLLLHRKNRLMGRFFHAYARLSGLGRRVRRRLGRRAAVSAGALALALTLSAAAVRPPPATAAVGIFVDDGAVVMDPDDGQCSLIEAFYNANNNMQYSNADGECIPGYAGLDTIVLPDNGTFTLTDSNAYMNGLPTGVVITEDTSVVGSYATITRDDGADDFNFISLAPSRSLSIENLSLSNGAAWRGGALYNLGELTLHNVTVTGNEATIGGGIFSGGTLTLYNSLISGNEAVSGGGIASSEPLNAEDECNATSTINIYSSRITNNDAIGTSGTPSGGGLNIVCVDLLVEYSEITENDTIYKGGGIEALNSSVTLRGSKLNDNTADDGAGIFIDAGSLEIDGSEVRLNIAGQHGGGVRALGGDGPVTITDSVFYGNEADGDGGGLELSFNGSISGSTFEKNSAGNNGGALWANGDLTITGSTFAGNTADEDGGGIFVAVGETLTIADSTLSGNTAVHEGGGILHRGYELTLVNSTLSGNEAYQGGGIYTDGDYLTLVNSTLTGNDATNGGGIYVDDYTATLSRTIVSGNGENAEAGAEIYNSGLIIDYGHSVFGHGGLSIQDAFVGFSPGLFNVDATTGGSAIPLSDILDTTLAANGGPTLTHNLMMGSPALDMAPNADCAADPTGGVDQRGETRPFDVPGADNEGGPNICDAGAVEFRPAPAPPVAVYMSAKTAGTTDNGVAFDNSDILKWDGTAWSVWFDGSAAFLQSNNKPKHNVNAFWISDEGEAVMSFAQHRRFVPDILIPVDGMDLVWWDGDEFSFWFDGSDVGLDKKGPEKIDALHVLPGGDAPDVFGGETCTNYLLISTQGPGKVKQYGGGTLKFSGEDVLGFCATQLGLDTAGLWHMVLDGSAAGLPKNSLDSISVDGDTLTFTTSKAINLGGGVAGGHSMVFAYDMVTGDFSGPLFKAADNGLPGKVDGLQMD